MEVKETKDVNEFLENAATGWFSIAKKTIYYPPEPPSNFLVAGQHDPMLYELVKRYKPKAFKGGLRSIARAADEIEREFNMVKLRKLGNSLFVERTWQRVLTLHDKTVIFDYLEPARRYELRIEKKEKDMKFDDLVEQYLQEKKKAADRCKRRADSVYGKKTSAYKSGAIVRCRRGDIWKKK